VRKGLQASSQSADTKVDAGQDVSSNHLNPNALNTMLCTGIPLFLF